jgi:hypothetical protein
MTFEDGIAMMGFVNQIVNECEFNVPNGANKVHQFVQLDLAIEGLQLALHQLEGFRNLPLIEQRKHEFSYARLTREVEAAHKLIDEAYAMEMLPAILGGKKWRQIRNSSRMPDHSMYRRELIVDAIPSIIIISIGIQIRSEWVPTICNCKQDE